MIASAHTMRRSITSARAVKFLSLLPAIHEQARFAFRSHEPEHRQELIAEVIANAFVAFIGLLDRGLEQIIYATPLAQYAIKQVKTGRRVGGKPSLSDA